jgi:unsaturated rhamnogalacturonyl hydrolase
MVGDVVNIYGIKTATLKEAPSAASLAKTNIYLIVDPDTEKETANPNFMDDAKAEAIAAWVKKGGVLVVLANDSGNAELKRFNKLTGKFGIHLNEDSKNRVKNDYYPDGTVMAKEGNPLLPRARKLYIKEYCSLTLKDPARPIITHGNDVVGATAALGKGTVLVIGDPWLYNEYVDGRKLPEDFDNHQALRDIVQWTIAKAKMKK